MIIIMFPEDVDLMAIATIVVNMAIEALIVGIKVEMRAKGMTIMIQMIMQKWY